MKVKDIMQDIVKVPAGTNITDTAGMMDSKSVDYILVEEDHELVGIVTDRDILRHVVAKSRDPSKIMVSEIASSPLITIDEDETVTEASYRMANENIRRLVVRQAGRWWV